MQLYALCDAATLQQRGKSLNDFVTYANKYDASILQYRNKSESLERIKEDLLELRKIWNKKLIINDHIELVEFCDGLHLGQEDLLRFGKSAKSAISYVRQRITCEKLLGISTHNEAEILEANEADLDYIGLGAFRATTTKNVKNNLGESLDKLASLSKFPVGAIGGVKLSDTFEHVTYLVIGSGLYED